MLTQDELKRQLDYDQETGNFTRKTGVYKGNIAGSKVNVYVSIAINGKLYYAHRLAFLYMNNLIPDYVDHKDGNPKNNAWNNLREASLSQNQWNSKKPHNNTSGYVGIVLLKKPWVARLMVNRKIVYRGYFSTAEEAARAYDIAAIKYYGEFAKLNFPITNSLTTKKDENENE